MKTHHRKRGRYSRLPEPPPVLVQSADSDDENVSEESKYLVSFDINNKTVPVNIQTPIRIMSKEDYEAEYGDKYSVAPANAAKSRDLSTKLPVASVREITGYDLSDAISLPNSYIRFIEKSVEELDGEVEYDMDEEDSAWLEMMNETRAKNDLPPVSMESFELLMDRLEKESYFLVQMNKEVDSSLAVIDDEAVCSICLDGECQNSNVILFCDMCNLAVHQDCYGVPYIPEGHWLCRRCLHSPSAPVDCVLCPNNGGAFKQTDRAHWAHVVCALWIPEVRFANTVFLEPIDSIESIPGARWRLTCYICKQRGVGACIQCHKTNCYCAFHVTCAQQAGLYMKMETVRDNNLGAVLVQKIAYCDTHAPPDSENKARFQAKKEKSVSPTDKMKTARRVLAKKRSVAPVISIPTIPPERIQEIAALITVPKKAYFIQRLIAYWTLKRQFRNGVPLLRRLQTSHLARRDEPKNVEQTTDIAELYRQLKYWQSLRQDLERARLLCELVRKREKFKKELIKVKQEYVETALCPFNAFLLKIIAQLKARDTGEIFIEPVDQNEVADYGDIVKQPMDLQTMTEKVQNFEYNSLEALEADFNLMISNCLAYNAKHTIFYKSGLRMKEQGAAIIKQAKRDLAANKFDMSTGLLVGQASFREIPDSTTVESTPMEEVQATEIDKELAAIADPDNRMDDNEIMCKLLQLLDKSEMLKHSGARMRRVKLVKIQMANMKRKLTRQSKSLTHVNSEKDERSTESEEFEESANEENNLSVPQKTPGTLNGRKIATENVDLLSSSGNAKRKRKESIPKEYSGSKRTEPSLVNAKNTPIQTSVIFKRPDNNLRSTSDKNSSVVIKRRRNKRLGQISQSKTLIPNSESFRVYRPSKELPPETDEESHSDETVSSSSCSCSEDNSEDSSSSEEDLNYDKIEGSSIENDDSENDDDEDSDDDSNSDDGDDDDDDDEDVDDEESNAIEEHDSKKSKNKGSLEQLQLVWAKCRGFPWYPALIINPDMPKGYVHNGVPIPSPPEDILALAKNYSEPVYLVWFYDAKRTWQWLPRTKLKPLGVSNEIDKMKLAEARKPADRKAVKKAYQEALVHKTIA